MALPLQTVGNMMSLRENTNPAANRHPPVGAHIVRPGDPSGMPLFSNASPPQDNPSVTAFGRATSL